MMTFDEFKARYPDLIPPGFSFQCGAGWTGILTQYFDDVAALLPEGEKFDRPGSVSAWDFDD